MAKERSVLREYLEALLIAVIFLRFTQTFVTQTFYIPSGSMENTLLIGDHLFVNRFIYGPATTDLERKLLPLRTVHRGDIVVFRSPENPQLDLVKRCIGMPGDEIRVIDKALFLNGKAVNDASYAIHTDTYPDDFDPHRQRRDNFGPYTVPPGHYFCMGDNRDNSNDSRVWGTVPEDHVKGRAFLIYWSFESEGAEEVEWPGFWGKVKQLSQVALNFFARTRWERTFRIVR
jgi:signal peptidase I